MILQRVADLVGSDRDRRQRPACIFVGRQPHSLGLGVIVIAELGFFDAHVRNTEPVE